MGDRLGDGWNGDGASSGNVDFTDRTVLITGAGQGIGRRCAHRFAALGATVIVTDVEAANAERVVNEIAKAGGRAVAYGVDVADEETVDAMVRDVVGLFGGLDVLLNNAALFSTLRTGPFEQITRAEWDDVMRVNVTGVFVCARAVAPTMRAQGRGRIVTVSSTAARVGAPGYLHYVTSKEAVIGLTRGLARELGPAGITVNAVLPRGTVTEVPRASFPAGAVTAALAQQALKRPAAPDDVADVAIWLASSGASFVTGQSIIADGGVVFS